MDGAQEVGVLVPTQDERTMATLAQVLQLVGAWIAPLIILIVKRDSKFVSFHALQALILQIVHLIVWIFFMMIFFAVFFVTMMHAENAHNNAPPTAIFLIFPFFWLGAMGMWVVLLVTAIIYGIKAGRGEWAEYPLLGRLARHFLKIGPDGSALQASSTN